MIHYFFVYLCYDEWLYITVASVYGIVVLEYMYLCSANGRMCSIKVVWKVFLFIIDHFYYYFIIYFNVVLNSLELWDWDAELTMFFSSFLLFLVFKKKLDPHLVPMLKAFILQLFQIFQHLARFTLIVVPCTVPIFATTTVS